jgi:hypothetical protein
MSILSLKKRKEMLVEAILAAEQRHGCKYEQDGQPVCVIGQLADICGIDVKELSVDMIDYQLNDGNGLTQPLSIFPERLLSDLQAVWDGRMAYLFPTDFGNAYIDKCRIMSGCEDDTRMLMLFMVEAWDGT